MKYIFILLLGFVCFRGNAQGIEFNTYESETVQKTSYSVFGDKPLTFKDSLSISYDLAILDHTSFGYVFRLNDTKQEEADTYSFVFSYDNAWRSFLKFNIEAKECKVVDTLCNDRLGSRRWIPIKMTFLFKEDSVNLIIGNREYKTGNLGLSEEMAPSIMFGSSKFSEEIPSFAIRNLVVSAPDQQFVFPLNESIGTLVHDTQGKVRGKAINPVWLINRFYHWNLLYSHSSETTAGYSYDTNLGNFVYFNADSLYTLDLRHNSWSGYKHAGLPVKMRLGTNFFWPDTRSVYIYEVDKSLNEYTVCSLDLATGEAKEVSSAHLSSQRHHHSSYLDTLNNKYYIFGGFGLRKYANTLEVYDLDKNTWSTMHLKGDFVAPRFFSSMGALESGELLLFGGTGNPSGDQSLGKNYYYDLYKINLQDSTITKIRDYSYKGPNIVPVRNQVLSADGTSFYTLCYPMQEASSYLQLYKFSLLDDSYEVLGNAVPMESKAILSNANLYYSAEREEFYCCTQEFDEHGGQSSVIRFYSLSAPAIAANALCVYKDGENSYLYFYVIVVAVFILLFLLFCIRIKKRSKQTLPVMFEENRISVRVEGKKSLPTNTLYLFGDFTVLDKKGRNITHLFSSKIKQLFLLILLNSIGKKEGITSSYIYGLLWPEKEASSAKNLKGVAINRLRKILNDVEGAELLYINGHYSIKLSNNLYCDYKDYLSLMGRIKQGNSLQEISQSLIEVLSRGKFLKSIDDSIFDFFKSDQESELHEILMIELENLYFKAEYEQVIQLADIWLKIDSLSSTALWYFLNSCHKLKREDQAMKRYYLYVAEFSKSMGSSYHLSYSDIIHNDLRMSFQ